MAKFNAETLFEIATNLENDSIDSVIDAIVRIAVAKAKSRQLAVDLKFEKIPNSKKYLFANEFIVENIEFISERLEFRDFKWTEISNTNDAITYSLSWNIDDKNKGIISINDIANEILAINNSGKFGQMTGISPLALQIFTFLTVREALRQDLLNKQSIQQIVEIDKFMLFRTAPTNDALQRRFAIFSASPILSKETLNPDLNFLDNIISDVIINTRNVLFETISNLRDEPFYKQHPFSGWRSDITYTEDAIRNN